MECALITDGRGRVSEVYFGIIQVAQSNQWRSDSVYSPIAPIVLENCRGGVDLGSSDEWRGER